MTTQQAQEYFDKRVSFYAARLEERQQLQNKAVELRNWLIANDSTDPRRTSIQTELLEVEGELYR